MIRSFIIFTSLSIYTITFTKQIVNQNKSQKQQKSVDEIAIVTQNSHVNNKERRKNMSKKSEKQTLLATTIINLIIEIIDLIDRLID